MSEPIDLPDADFPDAEDWLCALLAPRGHACTSLPAPQERFNELIPVIWITRNGGARDDITDRPRMTVAVFAYDRKLAVKVSGQCRNDILSPDVVSVNGITLDSAKETTAVTRIQDPVDKALRVIQASYELSFRRVFY